MAASDSVPSRSVFRNLMVSMLAFGTAIGLVFPPFAFLVLGTPAALSRTFFAMCVAAGLLVGGVNYLLFSLVVSRAIRRVAGAMQNIIDEVAQAEDERKVCGEECKLELTSADALGDVERSFNQMTDAIAHRMTVDLAVRALLRTLAQSVELDAAVDTLLRACVTACDGRTGVLYVDQGSGFERMACFGVDETDELPDKLEPGHGLSQHAIERGSVWIASSDQRPAWFTLSTPLTSITPNNVAVIPLRAEGRTLGLAIVALERATIGPQATELLEAIGAQGGPPLQNAVLHRRLAELAALDELTRILNRRFGLRRLHEEYSRSIRHGVPVSVVLIDVDHFKRFNDSFGHDAGDEVLRVVAETLDRSTRAGDVACRYGGEEFLMIAPGTGMLDAGTMAERLRRLVETTKIRWGEQELSVQISLGVATWPVVSCSAPAELITAADEALYFAKQSGRNRVAVQRDETPVLLPDLRSQKRGDEPSAK